MNFNPVRVNIDAWKGTGTVSGVHTHIQPVKLSKIEERVNRENSVTLEDGKVTVAKDLVVLGQLIAPGFPPPGGDMSLPTDPTFHTITTTGNITVMGNLKAEEEVTLGSVLMDSAVVPILAVGAIASDVENGSVNISAPLRALQDTTVLGRLDALGEVSLGNVSVSHISSTTANFFNAHASTMNVNAI